MNTCGIREVIKMINTIEMIENCVADLEDILNDLISEGSDIFWVDMAIRNLQQHLTMYGD